VKQGNGIESEDVHAILRTEKFEELLLDWMQCHLQAFEETALSNSQRENSMKLNGSKKKSDHT
jgi:hypothetical protein